MATTPPLYHHQRAILVHHRDGPLGVLMPNLNERLWWMFTLVVVISLIVHFDRPALLWPAFIATLVVLSIQREWRRRRRASR